MNRRVLQLLKLLRLLLVARYRRGIRYGVGAAIEHKLILASLDVATLVDIGANKGQFSLIAAEMYPSARIHAFEPLAEPAAKFRMLFAGEIRVTLYPVAIGRNKGEGTMNVTQRNDSSSLLPITELQQQLFPGTAAVGTEEVKIERLDSFLSRNDLETPALLKLDVQGYELEVLSGCESLLMDFSYVFVECSFVELYAGQALAGEVIYWLRKHGFSLSGVYNMFYDEAGKAVQADLLFAR